MNRKVNIKSALKTVLPAFFTLLFTFPSPGSEADALFASDQIISMELKTDFTAIQAERTGTPVFHDGELSYRQKGGGKVVLPVRVMARGNFRLNPANCSFPPLMIEFKRNGSESTLFANQKKLKLVTPCQSENDVIDEYIIYKMYNQVTDKSLKARLVRVDYIDEGKEMEFFTSYSFFIEDKDQVAERNNAHVVERNVQAGELNRENYLKLSVFQYIIGNLDWDVNMSKNLVVIEPGNSPGHFYAVPFDFDFSAFVNAEYTKARGIPEDILVERRRYIGSCFTEEEFNEVFDFYRGLRPVFSSVIKKYHRLSSDDTWHINNYVSQFYKIISDSALVKKEFLSACDE